MQAISARNLLAGLMPQEQLSNQPITVVTTDSRQLTAGCVFVAFPGERFDGHDFALQAIAQDAAYVVVNHPVQGVPEEKQIVCTDSYHAMMVMGANYRKLFAPCMIGVTGSVGKTTTKEFCFAVLSAFGETLKTEGNQNNELGVPRTLFRLQDSTEYAVVEMGMNHAGEIERLSCCAQPSAAIITGVGVAHIEHLGSRENILQAKLEICAGMPEGAPIALNYEDPLLRGAALPAHVRPVWFSVGDTSADVCACDIVSGDSSTSFLLADTQYGAFAVCIPALGLHNVYDALAAYSAVTRLGLDAATAAAALSQFQQTGMRQKVVKHADVTVIEDCYNANPDSMAAALAMFAQYPCKQRIALLADMLELGMHSQVAHQALGVLAAESGLTHLITYGEACETTAQAAKRAGLCVLHAQTHRAAADALLEYAASGDAILVKGSRSMALEQALALFYAEYKGETEQ
ncbi:MAG: UDP-N-acetylmuramoyl-tripeptide--D-alanyl-D-alanine ligase [Faecalibacterium sp.]